MSRDDGGRLCQKILRARESETRAHVPFGVPPPRVAAGTYYSRRGGVWSATACEINTRTMGKSEQMGGVHVHGGSFVVLYSSCRIGPAPISRPVHFPGMQIVLTLCQY